jgi:uncharacterized repeat protein (TIGR01451 family)
MPDTPCRSQPHPPAVAMGCLLLGAFLAAFVALGDAPATTAGVEDEATVATGSGPLTTRIDVQRLVVTERADAPPVRRFEPARRLEAGEEAYYTIRVTNPGRDPVTDVVVTRRLPYGVDYVAGSAAGPACRIEFSIDGGLTFSAKPGTTAYTHVRWIFLRSLAPGATALLRFRAVFR